MIPFNQLGFIFHTFGSFIYPHAVREALCDFLEPLSLHAKVLDIGSGTGMLCHLGYACKEALEYVAIDPAEGMMKYAKPYVKAYIGSAEELPFEAGSFDALMMGESLHHFRDVDVALKEAVRVLKAGGRLFIYDFNVDCFMGKSIAKAEKLLGEPAHFFTPHRLKEKLQSYGFEVSIREHGWRYTLEATLGR